MKQTIKRSAKAQSTRKAPMHTALCTLHSEEDDLKWYYVQNAIKM
jgi:hypothetical protein